MKFRNEICDVGRHLYSLGLIGANEGNISAKLDNQSILVTPSRACKGSLKAQDIVKTDIDGTPLDGKEPSSEFLMHLNIYQKLPWCQAIVHAHPPVATAFTLVSNEFPDDVLPESSFVLGPVALVPFSFPGTEEVPNNMNPFLEKHSTFLLSHHGAITIGTSLDVACERMEILERVSKVLYAAKSMGKLIPMPEYAVERIARIRASRERN